MAQSDSTNTGINTSPSSPKSAAPDATIASSTAAPSLVPLSNTQQVISLKLTNNNYLFWRMQMKPYLIGQGVFSFVDGSTQCPSPYASDILHLVVDCPTSASVWSTLERALASPSNSRIMQLHGSLQDLHQGDDTVTLYLQRAKGLFDELAAAGRPISLTDFNLYVFRGLRGDFRDLVTTLSTKAEPLSYYELHDHLSTHEFIHRNRLCSLHLFSPHRRGSHRCMLLGVDTRVDKAMVLGDDVVDGKLIHVEIIISKMGSLLEVGRVAAAQTVARQFKPIHITKSMASSTAEDPAMKESADWFPDTGANHHVTPDINGMTSVNPYLGNDQLHVGDGPTGHKTSTPLELIFSDVWGPAPMFSSDGFRYFVIFVDAHTKFIWYYPIALKSDVFNVFQQFQLLVERQFSCKIKNVQTDWGGEYRKLNSFFKTIGIHHRLICPHTHEQNGTVERRHRHIVETGLTMLGQCKAPLKYWNYAFETSVYLINRMPTAVLRNKSPFECLLRQVPDYAFLRVFRCLCFSFLRPYNAHKLDYRFTPCVFLGYNSSHLGYRCLDLSSDRVYICPHVRFNEHVFPFIESTIRSTNSNSTPVAVSNLPSLTLSSVNPVPAPPVPSTNQSAPSPSPSMSIDHYTGTGSAAQVQPSSPSSSAVDSPALPSTLSPSSGHLDQSLPGLDLCVDLSTYSLPQLPSTTVPSAPPLPRQHSMVLRPRQPKTANLSSLSVSSPSIYPSRVLSPSNFEPMSFKEADRFECWHSAMKDEISALHANNTWSLVPFDPSMNVVGCRWVYKIKRRANREVDRYKARLVARGFTQQEGIDYSETFGLVVKPTLCSYAGLCMPLPKDTGPLIKRDSAISQRYLLLWSSSYSRQHFVSSWVLLDADWAGGIDDRKSTGGYMVFLGSTPISWKSASNARLLAPPPKLNIKP
ncbi:hypothetical protein OIU77_008126 [Salix suchowensis]|uniref:Integrase catalytic domain-containing protein n=1 Tax=Salix suchowensis TaxID=1278906 RepID=A0ABQ9AJW1_9ROSI|nr:hypothetical protein OIU77_008126 [Salix suchowensis]